MTERATFVITAPETGERIEVRIQELSSTTINPADGSTIEPPQHPSRTSLFEAYVDDMVEMADWVVTRE